MRYKLTSLPSLRSTTFLSFAALLAVPMISLVSTTQAHAISSKYGCVKVTAESLNIRSKNSSRQGEVIAVAKRGEVLAKRGPTCPIRRFWCPVRNTAGVEGWASKAFIQNTACE